MGLHPRGIVGFECGLGLDRRAPQPCLIVTPPENGGHAGIRIDDPSQKVVRRHANDRATLDHIVLVADGAVPNSRQPEDTAIDETNKVGLAVILAGELPRVISCDGENASLTTEPGHAIYV